MNNIPEVKLGIVAVSRDCFPIDLSIERRKAVVAACQAAGVEITEIQTTIENEEHALKALEELKAAGCNDLSRAVMVGDREHDVIGAHLAGLDVIGVLYGYGSREELTAAGADQITETPEALETLILSTN